MKIRQAIKEDIPSIVEMLADDEVSRGRECFAHPLPDCYYEAFKKINADKNQELIVLENSDGEVIGTLQLTFIQCLSYRGRAIAQLEAVRVRSDQRNNGLGKKMIEWAIERVKKRDVYMLQLASNKNRLDAIRFYQKLGFQKSHAGMKLHFS